MKIKNFEFKARVNSLEEYENQLLRLNPKDFGIEHQIDTYFNAQKGRLKLREIIGKESKLIDYNRENILGSKKSDILLYKHESNESLKNILINQFGIKVIVDKKRKIYGINKVKFHFDTVKQLGTFIEVEAIDEEGKYSLNELKSHCNYFYNYFNIQEHQIEKYSYSDLLSNQTDKTFSH